MNREILFRGKRIDNGEWVYGDYFRMHIMGDIGHYISAKPFMICNDGETDNEPNQILPETVGQFTGLTDKSGNKIFEGDIITLYNENNKPIENYSIEFYKYAYCYVQNICGTKCYDLLKSEQRDESGEIFATYSYEIIGNIHDNPELLADKT